MWPVGYFLRAKLHFAALDQNNPARLSNTVLLVKRVLAHHNVQIHLSDWKSLPELTNENGIVSCNKGSIICTNGVVDCIDVTQLARHRYILHHWLDK